MQTSSPNGFQSSFSAASFARAVRLACSRFHFVRMGLTLALIAVAAGCSTPPPTASRDPVPYSEVRLREGDVIKLSFPSATNLDSTQQNLRYGKITLSLDGEVLALGRTPCELEKELLKLYDAQLAV